MSILEINKAFRNIRYEDKNHLYFSTDGEHLISVTQLINKLKDKFDSKYWSVNKAYTFSGYKTKQIWTGSGVYDNTSFYADGVKISVDGTDHTHLSVTPETVLEQWRIDSLIGTSRGTYAHKLLENIESRKIEKPDKIIPYGIPTISAINYIKSLQVIDNLSERFVNEYSHLIPVAIECIIGDVDLGIAGTFDRVYWNELSQSLEIWDFKTDKKMNFDNKYQKIKILNVDDCEYQKYSLQTSLYKYIVTKNTNLVLGDSYIARLNIKEESLDIHKCIDYTKTIANIDWRKI